MRIRTIKPEFWNHPVIIRLSDSTKLLALGLLNYADDEGYFYAEPNLVRAAIRPMDDNSLNTHGLISELSKIGYIELREHPTHGTIGWIVSFGKHQVVNRPNLSIIKPLFTEGKPTKDVNSLNDHGTITEHSVPEGKGTGKGTGKGINPPNPLKGDEGVEKIDDFEVFWKAYPKKTGKGKAQLQWKKQTPSIEACLKALDQQRNTTQWIREDGRYIPNPATWIYQKRWLDEPRIPNEPSDDFFAGSDFASDKINGYYEKSNVVIIEPKRIGEA
jgi:hypothetical protein